MKLWCCGCNDYVEAELWVAKYDWRGCYRPYGFVNDGEWIDADWDENKTFSRDFDEWFENLSEDTMINVIDCHE